MPRDPYEVLGVSRGADDAQIKKAFRRLARELHPDVNSNDPQAEDKFKEAAEAYEVLTDSERVQVRLILGCSLAMREQGYPAREMPSPAEDL